MKMTELIRYEIPPEVIQLWQKEEGEWLLPLQELVIKQRGLFEKNNLLIQAPTTSGKTFIGELAAIQTALRRKKVVYLVPLKALAEEKWADFQQKYAPYGVRVIISTRDHREFDGDLETGNFSLAVAVYEKLAQLLVRRPERLKEIELVIADELEILSDPDRGALVESLLTRLLWMGVRVIGLSAVIGRSDKLAQWMNAELVVFDRRPVELRYGVLHGGVFRYRIHNDYTEATERLVDCSAESPREILLETVAELVRRGESCLVFVKDKAESRRVAEQVAQGLSLPPATEALENLRQLEPTHSRDGLLELLTHGVALHNADLSPEERRIVERAFRTEEIPVMVSTSTLAVGMNLPAQNVFVTPEKWQYDSRFGMPWKTPILRADYENMGGRAGRYGSGKPFGRAILIASTPFDAETLWRRYVEADLEQVEPRLAQEPLENHILRLVASCSCRTETELLEFLNRTPSGMWVWTESLTPEEMTFRVRAALHRLADAGMIMTINVGRLEATPYGWAAASKGLTVATSQELASWIRESETRLWKEIDLVLAAALTPDGRMPQVPLTAREYDQADYPGELRRRTHGDDLAADVPLNRLRNCNLMPFFEEVRAIKVALFLADWIEEASIYDLESRYRVLSGQVWAAAEQIGWLLDATAALATACAAQNAFIERINTLAERIARGVREESLFLARLQARSTSSRRNLNRRTIIALAAHGLTKPEALRNAPLELLAQHMTAQDAHRLKAAATQELAEQTLNLPGPPVSAPKAPVLIVDDRHPDQIKIEGNSIRLQQKQYRLMRILATSPGDCIPYETIYEEVWGETVVEPNQMHFQKSRLLDRIAKTVPNRSNLVKTVPKRGFLLDLRPDEVLLLPNPAATLA